MRLAPEQIQKLFYVWSGEYHQPGSYILSWIELYLLDQLKANNLVEKFKSFKQKILTAAYQNIAHIDKIEEVNTDEIIPLWKELSSLAEQYYTKLDTDSKPLCHPFATGITTITNSMNTNKVDLEQNEINRSKETAVSYTATHQINLIYQTLCALNNPTQKNNVSSILERFDSEDREINRIGDEKCREFGHDKYVCKKY